MTQPEQVTGKVLAVRGAVVDVGFEAPSFPGSTRR